MPIRMMSGAGLAPSAEMFDYLTRLQAADAAGVDVAVKSAVREAVQRVAHHAIGAPVPGMRPGVARNSPGKKSRIRQE